MEREKASMIESGRFFLNQHVGRDGSSKLCSRTRVFAISPRHTGNKHDLPSSPSFAASWA